ncbi:hypothetical protein LCGC14_1872020 [marine sediment metagenome]|uniref:IstB-like ATP-binding domain-containing protein n=1 Tax=marine sediment metagenome TaxID=412755 RepID=A0A0F9IIR9_9ZZZZ
MSGFLETWDRRLCGRLLQRLFRVSFMIVDELGFRHLDRAGGELLFKLLPQRYKRCCTIVTRNLSFTEWVQAFGEEKFTTQMDWLGYHAHILPTKGVSYRKLKNDRDEIKRFKDQERAMENDCLELGVWIYHLAEKKRFTARYGRVLGRSWSHFVDSWNNAKICLNYGEFFLSLSERK